MKEKLIGIIDPLRRSRDTAEIADAVLAAFDLTPKPKDDPVEKLAKELFRNAYPSVPGETWKFHPWPLVARHVRRLLREAKLEALLSRGTDSPCYCSETKCQPCKRTRAAILAEFADVKDEPVKVNTYVETTTNVKPDPVEAEAKRLHELMCSQHSGWLEWDRTVVKNEMRTLACDSLARQAEAEVAGIRARCKVGNDECLKFACPYVRLHGETECGDLQRAAYERRGLPIPEAKP